MKKFWLHSLALSLGLLGYTNVSGQYPDNFNSLGASTYQVQSYPQQQNYAPQQPMVVQSLPQVPAGYYQQPAQPSVPTQLVAQQYNPQPYQLVSQDGGAIYNQQVTPEQIAPAAGYAPQHVEPHAAQHAAPHVAPQPYPAAQPYVAPQQQYAPAASGCQSCEQGAVAGPIDYGYQGGMVSSNVGYGYAPASSCGTGGCGVGGFGGGYGVGARGGLGVGGLPCGASPWFFGGGVLLFNRVDDKSIPLSFFDTDYVGNTMVTRDARMGVMPGFQVMGGRYFNCGRNAIQVSYFGIFSDDEISTDARSTGGDYRSRNPFNYLTIQNPTLTGAFGGATTGVYDWFDGAFTHQIERSSQFHNVEVNLLGFGAGGASRSFNSFAGCGGGGHGGCGGRGGCGSCGGAGCGACGGGYSACGGCGSCGSCAPVRAPRIGAGPCGLIAPTCGSRCGVTWLAGFRYFRFEDNLTYAASLNDSVISRSNDDLYYDVNTTNDLFGFQMGSRIDYCLGSRVNLYGTAKAGIYGNHSTLYTRVATEFQTATLNDIRTPTNPNNGTAYLFNESKDNLAFLGEIGCGMGLRVSSRWTATVGYRALFVDGVATSVGNYRESFANYTDVRNYDNYDNLVLHGIDIGAVYNF